MRLFTTGVMGILSAVLFCCGISYGQTTINSDCGYSITATIKPLQVIPSTTNCPNGYNYELKFQYDIVVNGTIPNGWCGGGPGGQLNTLQVEITCLSSKVSGYYNLPKGGGSGTATTTTNQSVPSSGTYVYNSPYVSCNNVSLAKFKCNSVYLIIAGPGINNQKVEIKIPPVALPIELINFDTQANNKQVDLKWSTASERNNDYFTIERTTDGINYETVAEIKGAGNSSTRRDYTYTDYAPVAGTSYYRLKQTDYNGDNEIFETKSVVISKTELITNVYPNPAVDSKINVLVSKSGLVQINLYNLFGQLVESKTVDATNSNITEQLELPGNGNAFIVELTQNGETVGRHKILTSH